LNIGIDRIIEKPKNMPNKERKVKMEGEGLTAKNFMDKLAGYKSDKELDKVEKFFKGNDGVTKAFGVKFEDVFKTAEEFTQMPLGEIEILLDSDFYEIRMGAVSMMDFQAKYRRATDEQKKGLFDLYLRRHDRLNNWDFVDRGAANIIGSFLIGKPKEILYSMAKSNNTWERRTAIVSTYAFIKNGNTDETFHIAEILIHDDQELINKAVGSWIREAGKKHREKLIAFLDSYATTMPWVTLRYAVEQFDKDEKEYYLNLRRKIKK
jgi:3-methyladenine DNA glycosylase AlkD